MLRILRQRNFALLWTGGLISMIGDWILIVGLPFEVYRRTGSTLASAALAFGMIDLVLFTYPILYPYIGPALVGMVIVGVPGAAMMAAISTLQQSLAGDVHRGRVIGAMMAIGSIGSLVGATSAGFLGEVFSVIALLVVQGSGYVIGGAVVWWLTRGFRAGRTVTVADAA